MNRRRGGGTLGPPAVTLLTACWTAAGSQLTLNFSEAVEVFGAVVATQVTLRKTNGAFLGFAVSSVVGPTVIMTTTGPEFSPGADFVTLAAGVANWLRAVATRVPVTAPVTLTSLPVC